MYKSVTAGDNFFNDIGTSFPNTARNLPLGGCGSAATHYSYNPVLSNINMNGFNLFDCSLGFPNCNILAQPWVQEYHDPIDPHFLGTADLFAFPCTTAVPNWPLYSCDELRVRSPISNELLLSFNVYPNPANNFLYLDNIEVGKRIEITDNLGSIIFHQMGMEPSLTIDISKYLSGIYFVRVGETVQKFVKL